MIRFGLQIVLVCLYSTPTYYHHCANLSKGIELIKCLSDIFCRVCKIKHILSVIHHTICGAVCFEFTHFSCDDWENIYTLTYYHHQIWSMNYYPLFRVRSWSSGALCMSFYIFMTGNYFVPIAFSNFKNFVHIYKNNKGTNHILSRKFRNFSWFWVHFLCSIWYNIWLFFFCFFFQV